MPMFIVLLPLVPSVFWIQSKTRACAWRLVLFVLPLLGFPPTSLFSSPFNSWKKYSLYLTSVSFSRFNSQPISGFSQTTVMLMVHSSFTLFLASRIIPLTHLFNLLYFSRPSSLLVLLYTKKHSFSLAPTLLISSFNQSFPFFSILH